MVSFMNKICVVCNKRPARIKFVKVVDGKWQDCVVCQNCLMRFAGKHQKGLLKLDHILQGLMDNTDSETEAETPVHQLQSSAPPAGAASLTCGHCGLSYLSYRNTLILGCSECYESFREVLAEDLRRFHGATEHVGREPENLEQIDIAPRLKPADTEEETPGVMIDADSLVEESGAQVIDLTEEATAPDVGIDTAEPVVVAQQPPTDITVLRRLLKEAIASENFEEAARLRDAIKSSENDEQNQEEGNS